MPSLNEQRDLAEQRLLISRANAIQAYAGVEQSLCSILSLLAHTDLGAASVIFYRIGSHPRNIILNELFSQEYGNTYEKFWNSMMKHVRDLDGTRNVIVHWHTHIEISPPTATVGLSRPATWFSGKELSKLNIEEIDVFSRKCKFVSRSLNMFGLNLMQKLHSNSDAHSTWLGIFQRPVDYPPQSDHPLFQISQAPQAPPQPSQG